MHSLVKGEYQNAHVESVRLNPFEPPSLPEPSLRKYIAITTAWGIIIFIYISISAVAIT